MSRILINRASGDSVLQVLEKKARKTAKSSRFYPCAGADLTEQMRKDTPDSYLQPEVLGSCLGCREWWTISFDPALPVGNFANSMRSPSP